ncbi:MAG: hypothetical protein AAFU59_01220 [Pseudomonadota bacterium]
MLRAGIAAVALVWAVAAQAFTPTHLYQIEEVHGWTVRVAPGYTGDAQGRAAALAEVSHQLGNIAGVVPEPALTHLRATTIWMEYRRTEPKRSVYHRSAGWLEENGFNPEKAKGIEIDHGIITRPLIAPWSLMHELAHAYFDTVLDRRHSGLEEAYAMAVASGRYERVMRNTGRRQPAYALASVSEFFAEHSEAYFGENDFQPATRAALALFDPQAFAALRDIWGD